MINLFLNIIYFFLRIFGGKEFVSKDHPIKTLFRQFILQKILKINGHVAWPVHWTSKIISPKKIKKGTRCPGLSPGCYIDGRNGIEIGENTWIGPKVTIISMNHEQNNYKKYIKAAPIKIGKNCWIGTGAIILPEIELGDHVIVAAGSVVTKSFKNNNILLAGVPAKIIRRLDNYED